MRREEFILEFSVALLYFKTLLLLLLLLLLLFVLQCSAEEQLEDTCLTSTYAL
jgi:hypothetical protein